MRNTMFALFGLAIFSTAAAQEADWKVGLARVKVTPEQPVFMAGYASRNKPYESVRDDLYAKAMVIEDVAGTRAVLVTSDLIGFTAAVGDPIRERIAKETGIPAASVLLNASHTHTGPELSLDPKPEGNRALADVERTIAYTKQVQDRVVQVVKEAAARLAPAKLAWGVGVVHFPMNRREFTIERGVILGVNPRGLADRSVPILRIDDPAGQLRAVVFGAACHNTTLGGQHYDISGDFTGRAQRQIEAPHSGIETLFVQGCAGDANPYPRGSYELADQHGDELAREVERLLTSKLVPIRGPLKVAAGEVTLPLAIATTKDELEKDAAAKTGYKATAARQALTRLERGEKVATEYSCPLAVWQFGGDLTLVALSGEVVVEYVKLIEEALGPNRLWVAAYTNDVYGYLPSARTLTEGGYETRGLYSGGIGQFAPAAQKALVEKATDLARSAGRSK